MKHLITALMFCILLMNVSAQKNIKFDTLYMRSGDVKIGNVTEVGDDVLKFVHKGETLNYSFKKADIGKVTFSSGRTETFAAPQQSAQPQPQQGASQQNVPDPSAAPATKFVNQQDHHNQVAVLPFVYLSEQRSGDEEMSYKIQEECYTYLSSKAKALNIQDPSTTNALLAKGGVTLTNYRSFTMPEIANILGVEYVMRGTVTLNKGALSTTGSANSNSTDSYNGKDNKSKSSTSVYGSSSTQQNFKTSVTMEVYMDDGKKVFGQNHDAFWSSIDAYKSTLQYLLKRTPVYNR